MDYIRVSVDRWQAETQAELARLQKEARSLWRWGGAVGAAALAILCMGGVAFLQSRSRQSLAGTLVALDRLRACPGTTDSRRLTFRAGILDRGGER